MNRFYGEVLGRGFYVDVFLERFSEEHFTLPKTAR